MSHPMAQKVAPAKRKANTPIDVPPKRARTKISPATPPIYTDEHLMKMSKDELIKHAHQLQSSIIAVPRVKPVSKEEMEERARKARKVLLRGVEKRMKWSSSCKSGTARFRYEGSVQMRLSSKRSRLKRMVLMGLVVGLGAKFAMAMGGPLDWM